MKEVMSGIYRSGKKFFTRSLFPGLDVYGERLIDFEGVEFRQWDPARSKLGAGVRLGLNETGLFEGSSVLYLGASTGTTISHVSDIIGHKGIVFGVDVSHWVLRDLVFLAETRKNVAPILCDANDTEKLAKRVCCVDVLFQDVAQQNQVDIFLKNCDLFLKKGGCGILALKARSVDVTKKPDEIFKTAKKEIKDFLEIVDYKLLNPFQKDHCLFFCRKV